MATAGKWDPGQYSQPRRVDVAEVVARGVDLEDAFLVRHGCESNATSHATHSADATSRHSLYTNFWTPFPVTS